MPRVDADTLRKIENQFEEYKREVRASTLSPATEGYLIGKAEFFIRWLKDDYTPGQGHRGR